MRLPDHLASFILTIGRQMLQHRFNVRTQKILVNYVRTIHKTHYVLFSQLEVKELPKLISLDQ